MWYLLSYLKHIPDVRIWTGILLVLFIFALLNIFVSSRFSFLFLFLTIYIVYV